MLPYHPWLFSQSEGRAALSNCNPVIHRAWNIYYLAPSRKHLPIPILDHALYGERSLRTHPPTPSCHFHSIHPTHNFRVYSRSLNETTNFLPLRRCLPLPVSLIRPLPSLLHRLLCGWEDRWGESPAPPRPMLHLKAWARDLLGGTHTPTQAWLTVPAYHKDLTHLSWMKHIPSMISIPWSLSTGGPS